MELHQEPTVKHRRVVLCEEIGDLPHSDPVVVRVMGLLEKEAHDFGREQRSRLNSEPLTEIVLSIVTHVMLADSRHELSLAQRDYLLKICFGAAGLRVPD